jgi:hypothetical protein
VVGVCWIVFMDIFIIRGWSRAGGRWQLWQWQARGNMIIFSNAFAASRDNRNNCRMQWQRQWARTVFMNLFLNRDDNMAIFG